MFDLLSLPGIKPVDIREKGNTLIVAAVQEDVSVPDCEDCNIPMYKHGTRASKFSDIPLHKGPVRLEVLRPRFRCEACGKTALPALSFLDDKRRATKRLVDLIRKQCLALTFRTLAEQTGVAVNTVKNIAYDLIAELEQEVRYETPVMMGIVAVNLAGGDRCIITNLATHNMVDMFERCVPERLNQFLSELPDREKVQWVCTDMGQPWKRLLAQRLPHAALVVNVQKAFKTASDLPVTLINAYTEDLNVLTKLSSLLGKGYSYDITRAKILYSTVGRKVGASLLPGGDRIEYGPHIPTLLKEAERGVLD